MFIDDDVLALLRVRLSTPSEVERNCDPFANEADALRRLDSVHIRAVVAYFPPRQLRNRYVSALVVEHVAVARLRSLCMRGDGWTVGAAATVLLGVTAALVELRAAGWRVRELNIDSVGFRADGCPVLLRYEGLERLAQTKGSANLTDIRRFVDELTCSLDTSERAMLRRVVEQACVERDWLSRLPQALRDGCEPTAIPLWSLQADKKGEEEIVAQPERFFPQLQTIVKWLEGIQERSWRVLRRPSALRNWGVVAIVCMLVVTAGLLL